MAGEVAGKILSRVVGWGGRNVGVLKNNVYILCEKACNLVLLRFILGIFCVSLYFSIFVVLQCFDFGRILLHWNLLKF